MVLIQKHIKFPPELINSVHKVKEALTFSEYVRRAVAEKLEREKSS